MIISHLKGLQFLAIQSLHYVIKSFIVQMIPKRIL
jgi:hypothetical protein